MSNPDSIPQNIPAALREIADKLETVHFADQPWVRVDIQPNHRAAEPDLIATCDAVAVALFDKPGKAREMSNGTWHHDASGHVGPVAVSTYVSVTAPRDRERQAELERLRARVAELEEQRPAVDPNRDPDWYIAQQGADAAFHRMGDES